MNQLVPIGQNILGDYLILNNELLIILRINISPKQLNFLHYNALC
jgi:hypothetical protein